MKRTPLLILMIALLVVSFTLFFSNTEVRAKTTKKNVILYSDKGFSPAKLKVKVGTMVTFTNQSSKDFWPASDIHPTHTIYPQSGGCGNAFDACKGIGKGESWSFTFDQKGSWKYHDHLRPSKKGRIIVK